MRHGSMGHRNDVVASDLDTSDSRRMSAGKAAIAKAMEMPAGTDRERGFITALNVYYNTPDSPTAGAVGQSCHGPVGPRDRVIAYEKAMRQLRDKYPDDFEAQTFYAFAIWRLVMPHRVTRLYPSNFKQARCWKQLWKSNPNHPGRRSLPDTLL